MTKQDHILRHHILHQFFDELVADFLRHNPERRPSETTLVDLMQWSHRQTQDPTPLPEESGAEGGGL